MKIFYTLLLALICQVTFAQWDYRGLNFTYTTDLTIYLDTIYASTYDGIYKQEIPQSLKLTWLISIKNIKLTLLLKNKKKNLTLLTYRVNGELSVLFICIYTGIILSCSQKIKKNTKVSGSWMIRTWYLVSKTKNPLFIPYYS